MINQSPEEIIHFKCYKVNRYMGAGGSGLCFCLLKTYDQLFLYCLLLCIQVKAAMATVFNSFIVSKTVKLCEFYMPCCLMDN